MSNEELVIKYQEGDKAALEELMNQNKGIIYKIANRYNTEYTNAIDKEDLIQEGNIGFIIAAQKYRSKEGAKFITYAVYWIRSRISRFIHDKVTNEEVSLNVSVTEEGENEKINLLPDEDIGYEKIEKDQDMASLRKDLDKLISTVLIKRDGDIVKLKYGWNEGEKSYEEIGLIYRVGKTSVEYINKNSLIKLRKTSWINEFAEENRIAYKYNNYNTVITSVDRDSYLKKFDRTSEMFSS